MKISSHWLSDAEQARQTFPALQGDVQADVAIIGGGFVGLWTALWLKQIEPSTKVVVLEQGHCGGGASGLNGGFAMSWWPKISSLVKICGTDDAVWLANETSQSVVDLGTFTRNNQIDAHYHMGGWLWTATTPAHVGAWRGVVELARRLGGENVFTELSPEEIAHRTGSGVHISGMLERQNATVHPAALGIGLAIVAAREGVIIHENSGVLRTERTTPAVLHTAFGRVTAERVVIATNAWAANVPELARRFVCVGSAVVATPPIPDRLRDIGWTGGESITDSQTTVNYYRTTRDGRIIFGKGGGRIYFTGAPKQLCFSDSFGISLAEADFRRVYPMLRDVPIERSWSGPVDRTYDSLPMLGTLQDAPRISYGIGWSGNGVNPSRIGGRILAGLALGRRERWTENGLVNRVARKFPPEPFRFMGGEVVRSAMLRKDRAELARRHVSGIDRFLVSLGPSGLEDKE